MDRSTDSSAVQLPLDRLAEVLPRYAQAGPRYTSYPTAPVWTEEFGPERMKAALAGVDTSEPLAVYVHVPFCESLCHFCACNRTITRDPQRPARFLDAIEREIASVGDALSGRARLGELHLGGGTPTHLTPDQLERLHDAIASTFAPDAESECSIEVDPRVTTPEHVARLAALGFRRISMGVQDFDPKVQAAIHRIQPVETTRALVDRCRAAGFESVGFDLIYGLPFQTPDSFARTLESVVELGADRIALYSYAHVTWVAKQQRGFERHDLPGDEAKLALMLQAIERLQAAGYEHLGMDHFALPGDSLARAARRGRLHRNFMGYTTSDCASLIGLGPSAISELPLGFAQSHRGVDEWCGVVESGRLATLRGHALSDDDRERRWLIARIMCRGEVGAADYAETFGAALGDRHREAFARLDPFLEDGLAECGADGSLRITPAGRLLVRNVAMVFDAYLPEQQRSGGRLFSRTV